GGACQCVDASNRSSSAYVQAPRRRTGREIADGLGHPPARRSPRMHGRLQEQTTSFERASVEVRTLMCRFCYAPVEMESCSRLGQARVRRKWQEKSQKSRLSSAPAEGDNGPASAYDARRLMGIDVAKLQQSFRKLTPKADILAVNFYDTLFDRYPETLSLFANTRFPEQREKLIRSLALVIRNIERPEFLSAYLQGLGAIHVAYGVKPEHYEAMGECLLSAL